MPLLQIFLIQVEHPGRQFAEPVTPSVGAQDAADIQKGSRVSSFNLIILFHSSNVRDTITAATVKVLLSEEQQRCHYEAVSAKILLAQPLVVIISSGLSYAAPNLFNVTYLL
jgi:hypothetical protein